MRQLWRFVQALAAAAGLATLQNEAGNFFSFQDRRLKLSNQGWNIENQYFFRCCCLITELGSTVAGLFMSSYISKPPFPNLGVHFPCCSSHHPFYASILMIHSLHSHVQRSQPQLICIWIITCGYTQIYLVRVDLLLIEYILRSLWNTCCNSVAMGRSMKRRESSRLS